MLVLGLASVQVNSDYSFSPPDIGGALYGAPMRIAILFSITISQIGFTCAYLIFVASNLQAFIMAITKCATYVSTLHLILAQLVVFLPLAMVRNLAKLSTTALVADAFILVGLVYIFSNEITILSNHGIADIKLFNPKNYALLVGLATLLVNNEVLCLEQVIAQLCSALKVSVWCVALLPLWRCIHVNYQGYPYQRFYAGTAQVYTGLNWCHDIFNWSVLSPGFIDVGVVQ